MEIKKINTEKAPKAIGPYVQANKVGELIFCSGQLGINPETGKLVDGGVLEEAKQVEFSYSFYTYALVGVGLDWIEKQMPESVEELVERIERVMLGEIISLL